MTIGSTITDARLRSGLSIRQLAAMANVSPSTLSRIEANKNDPSWTAASTLLRCLGARPGEQFESLGDESATETATAILSAADIPTNEWTERWERARLLTDGRPRDLERLLLNAGQANRISVRKGVKTLALNSASVASILDRLNRSNNSYALTGLSTLYNEFTPQPVIYVARPNELLDFLPQIYTPTADKLIVLPMSSSLELEDGGWVPSVSRARALVDAYSGSGREPDQADAFLPEFDSSLSHA